ncbi:hypothetical protein C8Q70DRAFT_460369 [Cubamyces menziesii]|nr:hypothetical protein C8Q70DRAFT_460369 [Cubamyces menziesii]
MKRQDRWDQDIIHTINPRKHFALIRITSIGRTGTSRLRSYASIITLPPSTTTTTSTSLYPVALLSHLLLYWANTAAVSIVATAWLSLSGFRTRTVVGCRSSRLVGRDGDEDGARLLLYSLMLLFHPSCLLQCHHLVGNAAHYTNLWTPRWRRSIQSKY